MNTAVFFDYLLLLIFFVLDPDFICLLKAVKSFQKNGRNYLFIIKLINFDHNSLPEISIKINCYYMYTLICISDKVTGVKT